MKKIIALLTAAFIFCAVLVFPASAAGKGTITMGSASAKQGESVTLNVNMASNPGLVTMTIKVSYDTNVLQLTSVKDAGVLVGSQLNTNYASPYKIAWVDGSATSNNTKKGNIASFTFKVKDAAAVGKTTVKLEFVDSFDSNYGENTFTATSGTITVNCKTHKYGSYTNSNSTNHTRTCTACGNVETKAHTFNSGTVTKPASCKETGVRTRTCTACNATKTETIAKTTNHTYGAWETVKEPTCTVKGQEKRVCTVCNKAETRDVKATGHTMGAWETTKEATCDAKGEQVRECSKCDYKETKSIDALGHKFANSTVTKKPTCTETGIETGVCERCNKETTNTIKATGHKMTNYTVTVEPTCTKEGKKEGTCSVCGAKATEKIAAKGHSFGKAVVTKEATETETGLKTKTCSVCNEVKEEVIPVIKPASKPSVEDEKTDASVDTEYEGKDDEEKVDGNNDTNIPWVVIIIVAVVLIGGIVVVIAKKKKK